MSTGDRMATLVDHTQALLDMEQVVIAAWWCLEIAAKVCSVPQYIERYYPQSVGCYYPHTVPWADQGRLAGSSGVC